jgi:hypothetical protein
VTLTASSPSLATAPAVAAPSGALDAITFGDAASEQAHGLVADDTQVITGAAGQSARVARPLSPAGPRLGDLRFTMTVDPSMQNYLTLQLWGGDDSAYRTMILVDGEQASFQNTSDHEPINVGTRGGLPGRFFFTTGMLPLASTQGRDRVEIVVRTFTSGPATQQSRGYYQALTHTAPQGTPDAADDAGHRPTPQVLPDVSETEKQALIAEHRAKQVGLFNELSARVDANPGATMSIERYKDELRFYAEALLMDWSPASSAAEKEAALRRIFASSDYVPGPTVGAYYFIRSFAGGTGVGSEQRSWLPVGDTPPGDWVRFERTYTTLGGNIDNVDVTFGLRGSSGTFRVDDLRVEPVA